MTYQTIYTKIDDMVRQDCRRHAFTNGRRAITLRTKRFIAEQLEQGSLTVEDVLLNMKSFTKLQLELFHKQFKAGMYDLPEKELVNLCKVPTSKQIIEGAPEPVRIEPANVTMTVAQKIAYFEAEIANLRKHVDVNELNAATDRAIETMDKIFDKVQMGTLVVGQRCVSPHGHRLTVTSTHHHNVMAQCDADGKIKTFPASSPAFVGKVYEDAVR